MKTWIFIGLFIASVLALGIRLPQLDRRPLHNDEAINAWKLETLWSQGQYKYDPDEYHGPTLYYFSLPFLKFFAPSDAQQWSDAHLRLVTIFFGAAIILLSWLLLDGLGWPAVLAAALLTAISPAMTFYSRYFIHEMLLIFFTLLLVGSVWRYTRAKHPGWLAVAGAAIGLMWATKETFVLAIAAMALAIVLLHFWMLKTTGQPLLVKSGWNYRHAILALFVAIAVAIVFYSSFFTNPSGIVDAIKTYLPWTKRAGGASPHNHPWYWYFQHLFFFHPVVSGKGPFWSETLVLLLFIVGAVSALVGRSMPGVSIPFARFLLLYTTLLSAIYAAISYKTPWCMLGFYHGMILIAGLGAYALWQWAKNRLARIAVMVVLAAGLGHLAWQTWRANWPMASSPQNPYTYSQTSTHILELIKRLRGLAAVHPDGKNMVIYAVSSESYWPLPWYLRDFKRIGWFEEMPSQPYPPVLIVNARLEAYLDEKTNKKWIMAGLFELRPKVALELYVNFDFWKKYVETLPRTPPDE